MKYCPACFISHFSLVNVTCLGVFQNDEKSICTNSPPLYLLLSSLMYDGNELGVIATASSCVRSSASEWKSTGLGLDFALSIKGQIIFLTLQSAWQRHVRVTQKHCSMIHSYTIHSQQTRKKRPQVQRLAINNTPSNNFLHIRWQTCSWKGCCLKSMPNALRNVI